MTDYNESPNTMNFEFIGLDPDYQKKVRGIDEKHFFDIVNFVNKLDIDNYDIYEELYKSQYSSFPLESERLKLCSKLDMLQKEYPLLEREKQGHDYEWIYYKRKERGDETFRFYFGVNPNNLYALVEKLTEQLVKDDIPVSFKFQQEGKKDSADRIILYTNYKHIVEIRKAIRKVYEENKGLFEGAERVLPWLYEEGAPGVYFTPEQYSHKKSYGEAFAAALTSAKKIYYYLFQDNKVRNMEQVEMLKKVVASALLRNGILINKMGQRILTSKAEIKTFYDKSTKSLVNSLTDPVNESYYEVRFEQSREGKQALMDNFYRVNGVQNQPGVQARILTKQERQREIYQRLYPQSTTPPGPK